MKMVIRSMIYNVQSRYGLQLYVEKVFIKIVFLHLEIIATKPSDRDAMTPPYMDAASNVI
jgi:hypothetical protein